jgi:hypothetical protein
MDIQEFPLIRFSCKENFTSERRLALKINKWLCVAYSDGGHKIFRMDTGLPLIETIFKDKYKCIELAAYIAEKYKDVFDIWEAEPTMELLRVAQYTIPNGTEVYKRIEQACLS